MAALAPPVVRDNFVYHDQLYVDTGNLNRHPRASIAELIALLRPEAAKTKKSAKASDLPPATPAKDPPGHFYTAQLIHYGLPPSNVKNTAKVRLLHALNAGTLEVPIGVKAIEEQMKKDYMAANRKAKADSKKNTGTSGPSTAPVSPNVHVNVTVNVDGSKRKAKVSREETKVTSGASKVKDPSKAPTTTKPSAADKMPTKSTTVATKAKTSTKGAATAKPTGIVKKPTKHTPTPKKSGAASAVENYLSKAAKLEETMSTASKKTPLPKAGPTLLQQKSIRDNVDIHDDPPPAYTESLGEAGPSVSVHDEAVNTRHELEGRYHFFVSDIDDDYEDYDESDYDLQLYYDSATYTLWGRFSCAQYKGIIKVDNPPRTSPGARGDNMTFDWRAENCQTGQLRFGRACKGVMWSSGNDNLAGGIDWFFDNEVMTFDGDWKGPAQESATVAIADMMQDWDDYVRRAYGRQSCCKGAMG